MAERGVARQRHSAPVRVLRRILCAVTALLAAQTTAAPPLGPPSEPPELRAPLSRALDRLTREGDAWLREQRCASCHHAPLLLWSLGLARRQGFPVNEEVLTRARTLAMEEYLAADFRPNPGLDTEPLSLGALYVLLGASEAGGDSRTLEPFREHLRSTQQPDGSWAAPDLLLPDRDRGRKPPLYDTRQVTTGWALLALATRDPDDRQVRRGRNWLAQEAESADTQAVMLRLLLALRLSPADVWSRQRALLNRQNADGGWSQTPGRSSDAFATGQALHALGRSGMDTDSRAALRARDYLLRTEAPGGGWSVPSRASPGHSVSSYAGTAWAAIGLLSLHDHDPAPSALPPE